MRKLKNLLACSTLLLSFLLSSCDFLSFIEKTRTVDFYVDGTYYNSVEMKEIDDELFPKPERYGNVFDGWYINDSYTDKYVEDESAPQEKLYGRFLPNEYTLTFVGADGVKIPHKVYHGKPIGVFPESLVPIEGISGYNWLVGTTTISENTIWRLPMDKEARIGSYELCDYQYVVEEIENKSEIKINPQPILANIHTDIQFEALQAGYKNISNYKDGTTERSQPKPIRISFKTQKAGTFSVLVSKTNDFKNAMRFDTTGNYVDVYNLEIATTYYYKVVNNTFGIESEVGKIVVEDQAPRNLYVPGMTNVRDIGGWGIETLTKRIRQGLIYRTARGNSITEAGKTILKQDLGIKTEIDLRHPELDDGIVGVSSDIDYYNFPINYEDKVLPRQDNQESIKQCFEVFADPNNYPIMYHCTLGRDRGGIVSILLGALLGMSENDLAMDYVFSNFENGGYAFCMQGDDIMNQLKDVLKGYKGESFNEKVYSYLLDTGLTVEQLETIRLLLIEDKLEGFRDSMAMVNFKIEVYEENSSGKYVDKTYSYNAYLQNNYFSPISDYDVSSVAKYLMPNGYSLDETLSELSLSEAKEKDKLKIYYKKV